MMVALEISPAEPLDVVVLLTNTLDVLLVVDADFLVEEESNAPAFTKEHWRCSRRLMIQKS
jgi:hypothetical protein